MPSLPYWLFPGDDRPPAEIDDEIAEELHLHLDLLAEQRMREGVTPDVAKQQAAERFGDYDTLLRQCRLEKQGDIPMLKRIQAVLIGILAVAVVVMGWQQWTMAYQAQATWRVMNGISARLSDIQDKLVLMQPNPSSSGPTWQQPPELMPTVNNERQTSNGAWQSPVSIRTNPLPSAPQRYGSNVGPYTGVPKARPVQLDIQIQDGKGNPLEDAVITTWKAVHQTGRDRIEYLAVGTKLQVDGQGNHTTTTPVAGFAAVAPGYAAMSTRLDTSVWKLGMTNPKHYVALAPSSPVSVQVTLPDGSPARHASIILARRTNLFDVSFDFPPQPDVIRQLTDDQGKATLDWLQAGDLAIVLVKQRGKPIDSATRVEFEVSSDASKVVSITLTERSRRGGEGFGGEFGGSDASKDYEVKIGDEADEAAEGKTAVWQPPLDPDPQAIHREAVADAGAKRFEIALAKHVWYHENATTIKPSLSAVRLSFALSDWYDLGCVYPPAKEKLESLRDVLERRVNEGQDIGGDFHDLTAMNRALGEPERTVASFEVLDSQNARAAKRAWHYAKDALLQEESYELHAKYVRGLWDYRMLEDHLEVLKRHDPKMAESKFRHETAVLIASLAMAERDAEASEIAELARQKVDDESFSEHVEAALRGEMPATKL